MRYELMPQAMPRLNDPTSMIEAIKTLASAGYDVRRPERNDYQLKVTPDLSFYPTKGTIFIDGDAAPLEARGLNALLEKLRQDTTPISIKLAR